MSSQMVKMTNGKKIKFSNLAFRYLAGEALTAQEDTAEPTELPTQENNTPSAAFDYDEKSDDLDHQLTLGNEFVFSIDGRGGAPTTAFITRLGSGLYRADISADQNENYKDESILFLGEQIDSIYYHAIIVSAEAINDRQRVADWIKKGVDGKDLSGVNFSWCDFSRCDLSGVRLSKCNLMGADFSGADLSINPAVRPIFAANSDAMDAEWHCVFAMMSDGAEYAEGLRLGSGY